MLGDNERPHIDRRLAHAWGLLIMSDQQLRLEAIEWGYGDCPDRFLELIHSL